MARGKKTSRARAREESRKAAPETSPATGPGQKAAQVAGSGQASVRASAAATAATTSRAGAAWALGAVAVAAAALLAYSNATPAVAIHDDTFFVPSRHALTPSSVAQMFGEDMWSATGSPTGVYRPLVVLSIAINGAMFGNSPVGYHATNVVLHAAASLAVFFLLLALLARGQPHRRDGDPATHVWIAALAAVLFAVHPVHTEAVDSVYNRSDIMATTFVAIALLALHRWHERQPVLAWSTAAALYLVALLCRESAVSLPLLGALLVWFLHADEPPRARIRRVLPAAMLAVPLAVYFVLRHFALSSTVQSSAPVLGVDAGHDLGSRLLYSIAALREYARMMVLPWPLRVSYEDFAGSGLALALAVHAFLVGSAIALYRRLPLVSYAIAFFYIALIPSTRLFTSSGVSLQIGGFVLLKPQSGLVLVAERVAYLPSVGFAIAAAALLAEVTRRQGIQVAASIAAGVAIIGGLITYERNFAWHSAPALFSAEVVAAPQNGDGWRLLVSSLTGAGRLEEAASACDSQLDQPSRSAQLFNNCGVVYDKLRRDDLAMKSYRRAIDLGLAAVGHANLGRVYARLGQAKEAEAEFLAAIEAETNPAQKHYRTGSMLLRFHPQRRDDARREFEAALAIQPDFAAAKQSLAQLGR